MWTWDNTVVRQMTDAAGRFHIRSNAWYIAGVATSLSFALVVRYWENAKLTSFTIPKRRFLVNHSIDELLASFEAAALFDAEVRLVPQERWSSPAPVTSDDIACFNAALSQTRAVLNEVSIARLAQHVLIGCFGDADPDVILRLVHVMMYAVALRLILQPTEMAERVSQHKLPSSYLSFEALFSFGRIEWICDVHSLLPIIERRWSLRALRTSDAEGPLRQSLMAIGDGTVRHAIEEVFFTRAQPRIEQERFGSEMVLFRLLKEKLWNGRIGELQRNKRRHRGIQWRVAVLILCEAINEVATFAKIVLNNRFACDCFNAAATSLSVLLSSDASVTAVRTSGVDAIIEMQLAAVGWRLALSVTHVIVKPLMDSLTERVRSDLSAEYLYELTVNFAMVDDALRNQKEFQENCSLQRARRGAHVTADVIVQKIVVGLGKLVGGGIVLGYSVFVMHDACLPFLGMMFGALDASDWMGSAARALRSVTRKLMLAFGIQARSASSTPSPARSDVAGITRNLEPHSTMNIQRKLEELDLTVPPSEPPRSGLRIMAQVLADEVHDSGAIAHHPCLALISLGGISVYGESAGNLHNILDRSPEAMRRIATLIELLTHTMIPRMAPGMASSLLAHSLIRRVHYTKHHCLIPQYKALSKSPQGGADSVTDADGFLDPEEKRLFVKAASYIRAICPSDLFGEKKIVTLRSLGVEVLHAHRSVAELRTQNDARLITTILSKIREMEIQPEVRRKLRTALTTILQQTCALSIMFGVLPAWATPVSFRSSALFLSSRSALLQGLKEFIVKSQSYEQFFASKGPMSMFVMKSDSRINIVCGVVELLDKLPAIVRESEERAADCSGELERFQKLRPELQWNAEGRVVGNFKLREAIEFRDVSFAYPNSGGAYALKHVSFTMKANEFSAIIGKTGSGKSTIISLLKRLYRPIPAGDLAQHQAVATTSNNSCNNNSSETAGEISFDGIPISMFDLRYLRSLTAFVPQEPSIFPLFTFAQNIAFFRLDVTMDDVRWAAKMTRCEEFILEHPLGYESQAGNSLSGGEKQRLELARAIVSRPAVLLLDEATSRLDAICEQEIQATLDSMVAGGMVCTIVAIAHRLSTLKAADRYIVLHDGYVTQQGSHEELVGAAEGTAGTISYREQLDVQRLSDVSREKRRAALGEDVKSAADMPTDMRKEILALLSQY